MKLLLKRSQKPGMIGMGKPTFGIDAVVELTPEERENVHKYKMGKEVVYEKTKIAGTPGVLGSVMGGAIGIAAGLALGLAKKALNISISVDDLVKGKHIACKDILEMRAAEEQVKEACGMFKEMLDTAAQFGGEEVVEF